MIVEYIPEQPKKEELFFVVKRKGEEESSTCVHQSLPWPSAQKREARPVLEVDNPFMEAVCKGNVDLVRDLLQEDEVKGLINSTDGSGNTPMFHAVARGNANMANLLLKHGANHVPIGIRIHTAESTFRAADIGLPKNRKNTLSEKETKKQRERRERMSEQRQISEWVRNMVCFRKQWAGQPTHKPRKARGVRAWQKNGGSSLKPALSLKKGVSASEVVSYMFTPIAEEEEERHETTHDEESPSDASCSDDDYEQEFNVEVIEGVSTLQEVLTAMEKEGHGVDPDYQAALLLALQEESEAMTAEKCGENQIVPASEEDWPALGGGGSKNAAASSSSHTNCIMGDVQVVPASSKESTNKFEMVDGDESDDWEVLSRSNSNASLSSMTSWDDAGVSLADAPAGPLVEMCDKTEREAQSKWGMSFKDILRANVGDKSVPSVPKPVMPPIFFVNEAEEEREEGAVPKGEAWDSIVDGIFNGDIRINERDSAGEGRTNNQYHDHKSRPSKGQVRASRRSGGVKC